MWITGAGYCWGCSSTSIGITGTCWISCWASWNSSSLPYGNGAFWACCCCSRSCCYLICSYLWRWACLLDERGLLGCYRSIFSNYKYLYNLCGLKKNKLNNHAITVYNDKVRRENNYFKTNVKIHHSAKPINHWRLLGDHLYRNGIYQNRIGGRGRFQKHYQCF